VLVGPLGDLPDGVDGLGELHPLPHLADQVLVGPELPPQLADDVARGGLLVVAEAHVPRLDELVEVGCDLPLADRLTVLDRPPPPPRPLQDPALVGRRALLELAR